MHRPCPALTSMGIRECSVASWTWERTKPPSPAERVAQVPLRQPEVLAALKSLEKQEARVDRPHRQGLAAEPRGEPVPLEPIR